MTTIQDWLNVEVRCTAGQQNDPTGTCTRHTSHHWCIHCEGFYGVPHDGRCHTAAVRRDMHIIGVGTPSPGRCACRYCKTWEESGYEAAEARFRGMASTNNYSKKDDL
jgi:hypothetical protein